MEHENTTSASGHATYEVEPDELAESIEMLQQELRKVLLSKRADYGTGNINATGQYGVAVRLLDKVHRLLNLLSEDTLPNHEAVEDTFADVANYGLIGLYMERKGQW